MIERLRYFIFCLFAADHALIGLGLFVVSLFIFISLPAEFVRPIWFYCSLIMYCVGAGGLLFAIALFFFRRLR